MEDHAAVFRKSDVEDLKKKLEDLLDHPDLVAHYREKAADFICSKYNWDDVVTRTEDLYRGQTGQKN